MNGEQKMRNVPKSLKILYRDWRSIGDAGAVVLAVAAVAGTE
jgi:hypothetical protein